MTGAPLLAIEGLGRSFGAIQAVDGITLSAAARERRAVIGPNGAGKTTLFNLITGQVRPTAGRVLFEGEAITHLPPQAIARRGIARSFQRTNVFPGLTVLENLRLGAAGDGRGSYNLFGRGGRIWREQVERAAGVAGAVDLAGRLEALVSTLSYGEQRQLEIGVALAARPKLLLLDEPTAGMSPEETQCMTRMLGALPRDVALLIIEHDMDVVSTLADRITVLHQGRVLAEGTFAAVQADPRVYEVYLGRA